MTQVSKLSFIAALMVCCWAPACLSQSVVETDKQSEQQTQKSAQPASRMIVHPGVAHSAADIEFVRQQIKVKQEPWLGAWRRLQSLSVASLNYKVRPFKVVERGPYNNPDIGSSEFSEDGAAAYVHALIWAINQDEAHAKKSIEILDAWSGKLERVGNHDAKLLTGMSGYKYVIAAELMKHTSSQWSAEGQQRFAKMAREVWYPLIKDLYPSANGNWDASMLQMIMAMGVHLDDQSMIQQSRAYFLRGQGNGAIGNYFNDFGQCQESGRDQAHTQMGLEFLSNTCETAWIQGIDLYRALDNRLRLGFEYTAKYNLGEKVPYERFLSYKGRYDYEHISDDSRGRLRPMYEKVLRHYQHRLGIESPYTEKATEELRSRHLGEREYSDDNRDRSRRSSRRGRRRSRDRSTTLIDILMFAMPVENAESAPASQASE